MPAILPKEWNYKVLSSENTISGVEEYGQTFTAPEDIELNSVGLILRRDGAWGGGDTWTVRIYNSVSDTPTGSPLVEKTYTTILPSGSFPSVPVIAVFDSPVNLTSGSEYAITVSISGTGGIVNISGSGDLYPDGTAIYSTDGGSTWGAFGTIDWWFEVWHIQPSVAYQEAHGGSTSLTPASTSVYQSQDFLTTDSHNVIGVRLLGFPGESSGNLIVEIRDSDGDGKPGSTVLGTVTIPKSQTVLGNRSWISGFFPSLVPLATNTRYTLVVYTDSGSWTPIQYTSVDNHHRSDDAGVNWSERNYQLQYQILDTGPGEPPEIIEQSGNLSIPKNAAVTLFVTANGTELSYRWYENGVVISGEESAQITVYPSVDTTYYCEVSNIYGTETSDTIGVTVVDNPYVYDPFELQEDLDRS